MIPESQFYEAVRLTCPGRPFVLDPESYEGLTMLDNGEKPSLASIEAAWDSRIPKPLPPISVSMAALRLAMGRDVCIQVGAYISSIDNVEGKWQAQTWWEFSPRVNSDHLVVEQFRVALNKTYKQISDWFQAAQAIDEQ